MGPLHIPDYSPRGHQESDTTECTHTHTLHIWGVVITYLHILEVEAVAPTCNWTLVSSAQGALSLCQPDIAQPRDIHRHGTAPWSCATQPPCLETASHTLVRKTFPGNGNFWKKGGKVCFFVKNTMHVCKINTCTLSNCPSFKSSQWIASLASYLDALT